MLYNLSYQIQMNYSNKSQLIKQTTRREGDSRNHNFKNIKNKVDSSRASNIKHDNFGKNTVNSQCAFHPSQKITNFCTSKQCLLPLCPKCVKIHTEEHVKMGVFGQFETIEESLRLAEDGLRYSFDKLAQLDTLLSDIKEAYESKIGEERRKLRQAKNYFIQLIETTFDNYEKALINISNRQNYQFLEELNISDGLLGKLTDHFQKCHKKLGSNQTLMQGVINYYTEAQQIERVIISEEKLQNLFPQKFNISYHTQELERLEATIKRYLDLGKHNDIVWNQYKKITSKEIGQLEKPKELKKQARVSPVKDIKEMYIPQNNKQEAHRPQPNSKNAKISQLSNLQSNLNLGKFKSPLDNFSLSNNRKNKYDLK